MAKMYYEKEYDPGAPKGTYITAIGREDFPTAMSPALQQRRANAILAIQKAQAAFAGVAEAAGISNDDDVQALVSEVRYGANAGIRIF